MFKYFNIITERIFCAITNWIVLTLLIINVIPLHSQEIPESVHYLNYTINDGLPSNETYDVFHDSKGFLWIGTDNGVVRYDGQTFETFTTRDGLTDNTIFKIEEDYLGRIWFMTYNRELCYYEDGEFKEYWFNEELKKALLKIPSLFTITNFWLNQDHEITLELKNLSILKIDSNGIVKSKLLTNLFYNVGPISSPLEFAFHFKSQYDNGKAHNKFILRTNKFNTIHIIQKKNYVFISTYLGFSIFNNGSIKFQGLFPSKTITGAEIDNEGGMWFTTLHSGLLYLPNPNLSTFNVNLNYNRGFHGILPQANKLHFCYGMKNSVYYDYSTNKLQTTNQPLMLREIPLASLQNGIKLENPIYMSDAVFAISNILLIDSININYISVPSKLVSYKFTSSYNSPFPEDSFHSYPGPLNKWLNFHQIFKLVTQKNEMVINKVIQQLNHKTFKIFKDFNGELWLGAIDGLHILQLGNSNLLSPKIKHKFINFRIQDIVQSRDSTMFFATKANGIFSMKDSIISNYNTNNGLLSNTIYQLVYDSNNNQIWATTNNGITVLTQNIKKKWTSSSIITRYDGMKSKDVQQLVIQNGLLFFANSNGVSKIKISNLFKKLPPPILTIRAFISNGGNQTLIDNQTFPYDSNNIQIEYHAISYKSLNDVNYQYQISPIDTLWRTTKNGHFNFQALHPNNYTFKIRAVNVDGVASQYKEFHFTIKPAFWMTYWFKAIIIIIAIYIGYQVSMRSIRNYRNQANMEKTLNKLRVISLQAKMNPHFIFNSLNSIQNFILKNEKEKANDYLLEFSKLIRIILQNSDSTTILLSKELDTLSLYVNLEMKRLRNNFQYVTNIDPAIDIDNCRIPSLLIQPYIENAIWHGKVYNNPEGEISIKINLVDHRLHFEITDNGIGIKNAQKSKLIKSEHNSLGSEVTKKRIELLSDLNQELSEVKITEKESSNLSTIYVGTRVCFSIPYNI